MLENMQLGGLAEHDMMTQICNTFMGHFVEASRFGEMRQVPLSCGACLCVGSCTSWWMSTVWAGGTADGNQGSDGR